MRKVVLFGITIFALIAITSCNLTPASVEDAIPATTQNDGGPMVLCGDTLKIQVIQTDPSLPGNNPPRGGGGGSC